MNVLITGGAGYIAQGLYKGLKNVNITLLTRQTCNLLDIEQVNNYLATNSFDILIHTAVVGGSRLQSDSKDVCYDNILMAFNLFKHQEKFKQIILLGSGAELDRREDITGLSQFMHDVYPTDPYGMSKWVITRSAPSRSTHLRIFNVFDPTERDTRFIKQSINNYIQKKPINIIADRAMSFFSMEDFVTIIQSFIDLDTKYQSFDCVYKGEIVRLTDIANIINCLGKHKVEIIVNNPDDAKTYFGSHTNLDWYCRARKIKLKGLEKSINNMYKILKHVENER